MMEALLLLTLAGNWQMAGSDPACRHCWPYPRAYTLPPRMHGTDSLGADLSVQRVNIHAASAADDSSTQVGTMGRYVPEPAGMLGSTPLADASLRPAQVEDTGPSQREEQVVHVLLGANAFFSVGSRLFTQRCLGEATCYERNKLTRDLYTDRPIAGIMVQAASVAVENYLLWRIHDNADKRPWVRAAIVGVLAFNVWNFANDYKVYKQTGRNR